MNAAILYVISLLIGTGQFNVVCQTGYQDPYVEIDVSGLSVDVNYADYETARQIVGVDDYACDH